MNLSAIMGRIAGKNGDSGAQPGAPTPGDAGIATKGSFAALVQFATQAGSRPTQGELGLVVDVAALPSAAVPDALADVATTLLGEAGAVPTGVRPPATMSPTGGEAVLRTQFVAMQGKADAANAGRGAQADATVDPMIPAVPGAPIMSTVAIEATPAKGDAPASPDEAVQAQIFGIPTGAAAMAAMASWAGQGDAAEPAPSALSEEGAAPAFSIASATPIATLVQTATAPETRIVKGSARFVAPPAMVTLMAPGAVNPERQAGDVVEISAGRTSEPASAPVGAVLATSAGGPLRMIVDSLPPVVQSTLTVGGIATVSGPSTGDQLGDQVIDMGVSGQWIDRMAREITALAEGSGHSRFTLNPPHLGRLQVDLWQGQDATSVRLVAETDEAARRLGDGRAALQADARMAALNLGSITIEKAAHAHDSARDSGGQRTGAESQGQMQQQAAGQQGNGQGQARSGGNQSQGEWVGRTFRPDQDQQGDASPSAAARRAASDHVRFA